MSGGGFKLCGYSISDPWLTRTVSPIFPVNRCFPLFLFPAYFLLIFGLCNKNGDPNFRSSYGAASSGENHMACDRPKFIHDVAIWTDLPMIPIYKVARFKAGSFIRTDTQIQAPEKKASYSKPDGSGDYTPD
jgi:hypothetical protein